MSKTFYSLRYHNFALWFFSNLLASTGTWMQRMTIAWLVLADLTDNGGFQVGVVTALQFAPLLFLSPIAGVIADRADRRKLLQCTQAIIGVLTLVIGVLVLSGVVELWHIYVLSLLAGCAAAIDNPARQAFSGELVPADALPNAIALNATAFNSARLIGPALAGLFISWVGIGWVFVVNAMLFVAPIISMILMRASEFYPQPQVEREKGQIREGITYVCSRPDIIIILIIMGVISAFGINFQITTAMMAKEVYHKSAGEYGVLGSCLAVGALIGTLMAARRPVPRLRVIVSAAALFGICEIALALAPSYLLFAVILFPVGITMLTMVTSATAAIQISTVPEMRGRVLALFTMIFLGSTPIGAPLAGYIGEAFGPRLAILFGGILSFLLALVVGVVAIVHWRMRFRWRWSWVPIQTIGPMERSAQGSDQPRGTHDT